MATSSAWIKKAAALKPKNNLFIDGKFVPAASGKRFETVAPRDGSVITKVARGEKADVDLAVKVAAKAFESGVWSNATPRFRQQVLTRLSDLMLENREELALLEALETGHPISDSMNVDVPSAARTYRWYAEAIDKVYGKSHQLLPTHLRL